MDHFKAVKVAPSILSADFTRLKDEVDLVTEAGADLLHVDVMDGHFVPNITIGPCVVRSLKKVAKIPLDVHLMITSPEKYLADFVQAGSDWITFHIEAVSAPQDLIRRARDMGVKVGISLKPRTPVSAIEDVAGLVDLVLVMSVEPGFGGQHFNPEVLPKIAQIRKLNPDVEISIDGGINIKTAAAAIDAGADILVAGSAIFYAPDPRAAVRQLKTGKL